MLAVTAYPSSDFVLHDEVLDSMVSGDDDNFDEVSFNLVSGVSHGSLSLASDGSFEYTPNTGYVGSDSFEFEVTNGTDTDTATAGIDVFNTAPVADAMSESILHDNVLESWVSGYDDDFDEVSFSLAVDGGHGSVSLASDGAYTYTPDAGYVGADSFDFTASDGIDSSTATISIDVFNTAPVADAMSESTLHDNVLESWASGYDEDLDEVSFSLAVDGSHGSVSLASDGAYTYTPDAGYVGADSFDFTVSDGIDSTTATISIDVFNTAPVAYDAGEVLLHDQVLESIVDGYDEDLDPLTFSLTGDGDHGAAVVNSDGSYTYTPDTGYVGSDVFYFTVFDGAASDTGSVTIDVYNTAPTADNASETVLHDQTLQSSVMGDDLDGDTLTFSVSTGPTNGLLSLNNDGSYIYTPDTGYVGSDSFEFSANDGAVSTAGTVTIDVTDIAPVANDDSYMVEEGAALTVDDSSGVLQNDEDEDGDSITASLVSAPSGPASFMLNADGSFSFTPDNSWNGSSQFVYEISDGGETSQATVTLTFESAGGTDVDTGDKKDGSSPGSSVGAPSGNYVEGGNDVVAIYDNDDGVRPAGIADTEDFQEAADDFANHYGAADWQGLVTTLTTYVQNHGLIDDLYIFDHGYSGSGGQEFGDNLVTAAMWADIQPLLSDGATVTLAGCWVGSHANYCDSVADATGANVKATAGLVKYKSEWLGADYYADDGTWLTFDGSD